jgi:hypothetical protein
MVGAGCSGDATRAALIVRIINTPNRIETRLPIIAMIADTIEPLEALMR